MLQELIEYFENNTEEEIRKEWEKHSNLDKIGISLDTFLTLNNVYKGSDELI